MTGGVLARALAGGIATAALFAVGAWIAGRIDGVAHSYAPAALVAVAYAYGLGYVQRAATEPSRRPSLNKSDRRKAGR